MDYQKIDGSYGEGGGQIIRNAITLSTITKKPIQIDNIRAKRKVPGLRAQHLTGVRLLAKLCNANVEGLKIGSTSIKFEPGELQSSHITEDIGTAGSISLIFQGLIPAVAIAKKELRLSITGGTDVPWSPTANYTMNILAEAYSRMGIKFSMDIKQRGYYPKGGGVIDLNVFPCDEIKPIILSQRNEKNVKLYCSFSKLDSELIDKHVQATKKMSMPLEERLQIMIKVGRRFNRIAVPSLIILIVTGLYSSQQLLSNPGILLSTSYGSYLVIKILLVIALIIAFAVHVRIIRKDVEEKIMSKQMSEEQIQKLRKKIIILGEVTVVISVAILFFAAVLDAGV